jgi:hypothetical protein
MDAIHHGKMFGDLARHLVDRQEVTEPLKGFEQDQKANSERSALGESLHGPRLGFR